VVLLFWAGIAAIRGTKNISDVITDIAGGSTPLDGGRVHWGMLQAARALLREEMAHLAALTRSCPGQLSFIMLHVITCYMKDFEPAVRGLFQLHVVLQPLSFFR